MLPSTITIDVPGLDVTLNVNLSSMNDETLLALVTRGIRDAAGDANAGRKAKGDDDATILQTFANKVRAMESNTYRFGSGGGGAKLSPVEREIRVIIANALMRKGTKAADAVKDAIALIAKTDRTNPKFVAIREKAEAIVASRDADSETAFGLLGILDEE